MNENSKKIIEDLRKAGIDTSSIERQLQTNIIADKQFDHIVGGGILRQQEYTRYMNDLQIKERNLQNQLNQVASGHDAINSGIELSQEQKDAIKKMEDALIATGEFEEESIRNLSRTALKPVIKVQPAPQIPSSNPAQQIPTTFQQPDLSGYVDINTFQAQLANMAYGGIATGMEINAALDEVKSLGIPVDRQVIRKFQQNLRDGYEKGKGLDQIVEETFEVSKALEAKRNTEIENRINTEAEKRVAERLKEIGVPEVNKFAGHNRHVLFGKNRRAVNNETPEGEVPKELPKNKYGDTEIFRARRSKEDRMQGASAVLDEVMTHYANDPTFVE